MKASEKVKKNFITGNKGCFQGRKAFYTANLFFLRLRAKKMGESGAAQQMSSVERDEDFKIKLLCNLCVLKNTLPVAFSGHCCKAKHSTFTTGSYSWQ